MDLPVSNGISISIANERIWRIFYEVGTEMVLTKTGRNLFPKLQYKIVGLEPERKYAIFLRFELVDSKKYKHKLSTGWTSSDCCDPILPPTYVQHPDGSKKGEHWMKSGLAFDRVKITNNSDDPRDNVLLQSMRKYRPTVTVFLADEAPPYFNDVYKMVDETMLLANGMYKIYEFSSPIQDFVAVTAYQNTRITELKIKNNPYAKGFREGPKNRKRSLSSTGTTPSPELKRTPTIKSEPFMGQPSLYGSPMQPSPSQFPFQQSPPMYPQFYQYPPAPQMFPQMPGTSSQFYPPMPNCYYQSPWALAQPTTQYMLNTYPNNPSS